jgi:hypothetical protein
MDTFFLFQMDNSDNKDFLRVAVDFYIRHNFSEINYLIHQSSMVSLSNTLVCVPLN